MNFGEALENLKQGEKVARAGWNGKNMFLFLIKPVEIEYKRELPKQYENCEHLEVVALKTANNKILIGWTPDGIDMLAEDWGIVI